MVELGRHGRLKSGCLRACGFESHPGHTGVTEPPFRNFTVASVSSAVGPAGTTLTRGSFRSTTPGSSPSGARGPIASTPAPVGREAGRLHAPGPPRRLRGARPPLPAAAARLLPPHAVLAAGRRGRAPGGLRRRLQRDVRRRAPDQHAPVAVPDRAQPLPQPPAQAAGRRARLDGRLRARRRDHDRRHGPQARGVPPDRRRRAGCCRRRSGPRCCCARSTRSPTTRSPRRWTRPCRASSRFSCARACRSRRRPRRACSPAPRCGSSSARSPRG